MYYEYFFLKSIIYNIVYLYIITRTHYLVRDIIF